MTAGSYLATKPTGAVQAMLIIALVLFVLGALASLASFRGAPPRIPFMHYVGQTLVSAGLAFFVLAFLVSG
jgi:hypothetical protein